MRIDCRTEHPFTDEACREATGKSIQEWYEILDARGGTAPGRREIGAFLYGEIKGDGWWSGTLAVEYEDHHGLREKDGRKKGYFICSTKTLGVPLAAAYGAWATRAAMAPWFGEISGDMVEGAELTDGDGNRLVVKRVRENKDLRFTWITKGGEETLVDVQFADKGNGKTGLLINHDRIQTRAEADGIRRAWSGACDTLKAHLEKN